MPTYTQKFNLADDVAISAVISNPPHPSAKPTLVFLHYWGGSSKTWQWVKSHLADEFPTVAIDFRGWGESSGPASRDAYSMPLLAGDVEAVIAELGLGDFVLIGMSMGAKVAQVVAAHAPAGLRSMMLLSPAPLEACHLPAKMKQQQLHAYENLENATYVTRNVLTACSPAQEVVDALVADQMRGNIWARDAWPELGMEEDLSHLYDAIRVPTLVLPGEKDIIETPARVRETVYEKIKGARWGEVQGSGHLCPVDRPEGVATWIRDFVQ